MNKALERLEKMKRVETGMAAGRGKLEACVFAGISTATYWRWSARHAEAGLDGLADLPRSGRPRSALRVSALTII